MNSKYFVFGGSLLMLSMILIAMGRAVENHRPRTLGPNPFFSLAPAHTISVMSYNIENLFDNVHDAGKSDYPFLPLAEKKSPVIRKFCESQTPAYRVAECLELDWRDEVLERKLQAVAASIQQIRGVGPDILILQEVENLQILSRLANGPLKACRYQTQVLLEGQDPRGIDVALLSRFPIAGPAKLHGIDGIPGTRGILEVPLQLPNGQPLTVFGFHFPSQFHDINQRRKAIAKLAALIFAKGPEALVIAGGDSNISAHENARSHLIEDDLNPLGIVSHQVGCQRCQGTHFYAGQWSFLDWIFFSKKLSSHVDRDSIITPIWGPGQVTRNGIPIRFNESCHSRFCAGVSDHLPIYSEFNLDQDFEDNVEKIKR